MATNEIAAAARAICEEKGISMEAVIEAIESALAAAYRKDYGEKNQNIKVEFDLETAKSNIYDEKTVVEDMPEDEETEDGEITGEGEEKRADEDSKKVTSNKSQVTSNNDDKDDDEESKKVKKQKSKDDGDQTKKNKKLEIKEIGDATAEEDEEEVRRFNPRTEIQISDAKQIKKSYKVGDIIKTELKTPEDYGRMAAQTAKQVIIQRIREVERTNMFDEFKDKEKEVLAGVIQRREGRVILVDLGRTNGILTPEGQVPGERYESGQRIKVYVEEVRSGAKGPEIILSRTSVEIVKKIFLSEIPEISNGLVEIKAVSREAGSRSKIAVHATEENVDPIGSCVGQRGARISTIISELGGEKIDIIEYSEDAGEFIANALSPAKVVNVKINEDSKSAVANVASDQLSLAIGKGGQNVRLAARLTGWKIDVKESKTSNKEQETSNKTTTDDETEEIKKVENEKSKVESTTTDDEIEKLKTKKIVDDKKTGKKKKDDNDEDEKTTSNEQPVTSDDGKKEEDDNKKKEDKKNGETPPTSRTGKEETKEAKEISGKKEKK
ncbi:MAG: transcription termination factor NusA [Patescibacteria group bacterium]|jgi:N utilization substance protein A